MRRREFLKLAGAASAAGVLVPVTRASAQALTGKQIRVVVPFPAGGPTDIVARPLAQMLGDELKAVMVIDNRGGAGGSIGADVVAKSAPDGQTILVGTVGTHAINCALYKKLPYDALRDFTAIAAVAQAPVAVVVHPALSVNSLADLVALAKKKPGELNYGSAGVGTPGHLTAEMFKSVAGVNIQHVPYKGSAPAVTDLIGGQIQIMFDPLQSVLSNVQAAKLRALALSGRTRSAVVPDVPTIAESGYDNFETTAWWGVFAPAGMPAALQEELTSNVERIAASDAFRSKLEPLGVTPVTTLGGAAFLDFQRGEISKWARAVQDAGISID